MDRPPRVPVDELTLRPDLAAAFPPTRAAALERAHSVDAPGYARTRNHLRGAVSRLSPYLTHGLVSVPDVLAIVAPDAAGKFARELAWREFFQLVYEHEGRAIFADRFGPQPRRSAAAHPRRLPRAIAHGHTGIDALDDAVRGLVDAGYVHDHARMWLASVTCHVAGADWRAGAAWFFFHLLDGDLASNTLSWQWVAGTGSHKPYVVDQANLDPDRPLLAYHPWALDPTWRADDDAERWLLLEPAMFARHPWSRDRLTWVLTAALEVPGLRVAVADARTLIAERVAAAARGDAAAVRHRTHPAVAHWPGAGDTPPRAFANRWTHASAPRSFSAFWKRVGPEGR